MNMKNCWVTMDRICVMVFFALAVGCSQGGRVHTEAGDYKTIRAIEAYYTDYVGKHNDLPPKSEQAFREFLNSKQDDLIKDGISVDKMFVSPRNGEPLVWVYGKAMPRGPSGMRYIAWEKSSADGKRLVIAAGGMYEIMDEGKFNSTFPNSK